MDPKDYLKEKEILAPIENLTKKLLKRYRSLLNMRGIPLKKSSAELGLLILNEHPEIKKKRRSEYYYYGRELMGHGKRYAKIKSMTQPHTIWEQHKDLLDFLFPQEVVPLVITAWDKFPHLMYQSGYTRRSFRGPHLTDIHFLNQLNFILELVEQLKYGMPLTEYILHSNSIYAPQLAYLFAAAIDAGNTDITTLLMDIVYMRHETGRVSQAIIKGMLLSESEEAWVAVEKLLLSAQRQEGLRQTILETLDECSLGAMKHMIQVIIDHKLARFSSVVRAIDVWAGLGWENERETAVRRILELAHIYLESPEKIPVGVKSRDNAEVYMALWAQGVRDVRECVPLLETVLRQGTLEKIVIALYLVHNIQLTEMSVPYGLRYLKHEHLMVFALALHIFHSEACLQTLSAQQKSELFDLLAKRIPEVPKKGKVFTGKGFSWLSISLKREHLFNLMIDLISFEQETEVNRLLDFFEDMPLGSRERVTRHILKGFVRYSYGSNEDDKIPSPSPYQRDFAFRVLKDRSSTIRTAAMKALQHSELRGEELSVFVEMLKRKSADTRKEVLGLLLKQETAALQPITHTLLTAGNQEQRLAGLDVLIQVKNREETAPAWIQTQVTTFAERTRISPKAQILLDQLLVDHSPVLQYNQENGYGLYEPQNRRPWIPPTRPISGVYIERIQEYSQVLSQPIETVNQILQSLKMLFEQHQDYEYTVEFLNNTKETILLANDFRRIKNNGNKLTDEEIFYDYPLAEVWEKWMQESGLDACDLFWINLGTRLANNFRVFKAHPTIKKKMMDLLQFPKIPSMKGYKWENKVRQILDALQLRFPYAERIEFMGGLTRTFLASLSPDEQAVTINLYNQTHSSYQYDYGGTLASLLNAYLSSSSEMEDSEFTHLWQLEKWRMEAFEYPNPQSTPPPSPLYNYARAYALQLIGKDELMYRVLMPDAIKELTLPKPQQREHWVMNRFPFLKEGLEAARARILEIELKRGDSSTSVTRLAQELNQIYGIDYFSAILTALGKENLHRGYIYSWGSQEYNRKEILSTLLKRCYPIPGEEQAEFNRKIRAKNHSPQRLIEAATYAPQWLPFVAKYLGWESLPSAVWWLHAHTNSYQSSETVSIIGKYSKVSLPDFADGAVDIDWFREVYAGLGKKKWETVYAAAKYICDGGGYKRAQLYADSILGKTNISEIKKKVKEKRNQDAVRALGLVRLSRKTPEKDVLARYRLLQQFKKESRQFGSMRQTSEGLAVRIAMDNLSRTAGYSDPLRLTWAMETEEARQILDRAIPLKLGEVEVTLDINEFGLATLNYTKKGKPIRQVPAKYRKDKAFLQLKADHKTLKNQFRRTKASLEQAMVNGDSFSRHEMENLMQHPVVAPMLEKLVLKSGDFLGMWEAGKLCSIEGEMVLPEEGITLAHCTDLFTSGQWASWQRHCFEGELVQPFKQIFRELYVPTEDELAEKSVSRRYAGHQVQPKKTVALLKTRGWIVDQYEGLQKVFHGENFIAKMYAMADWFTPADVESPTLETVQFLDRQTLKHVAFEAIPPRIFSEVMRDIDLVVSVAHVGGVDPEASHSSIELRAAIVRETLRLFKLDNVELTQKHALIQGQKGNYSVHLGSAVVHQRSGSYLSILPVHSQKRGRFFLPFLDDDPKSAEVLAKIILLAKDQDIHDPTILRQLA